MKLKGFQMPRSIQFDEDTLTPQYGEFIVEPLERGFGTTLGNALRRTLLSSIEGAAVSAVKFDGVLHEFSALPGVVEDVPEIILNLKSLAVRLHGDEDKKIYLNAKREGEITAADIRTDGTVEIVNPDLYIATLNKGAELNMELTVTKGRGYVEAVNGQNHSIGMIPIDAIYSPVKRVNYRVMNTRVGQRTDYDRLLLEVVTDGSLSPDDAVIQAAHVLREHLLLFVNLREEPVDVEEEEVDRERERIQKLLQMSVDELELSVRSSNCLQAANIDTLGDLVQKTEVQMLKYRNFGRKSLQEISSILEELGLHFGMDVAPYLDEAPVEDSASDADVTEDDE
ncbi:MAG: DNA-directed RNA polymerase subunit alpha [Gemmatimonadetes bacterium]|nr:MAG: DNA-directed RNA polymerase subunit alpha [Gemmatimonadota bacterium]